MKYTSQLILGLICLCASLNSSSQNSLSRSVSGSSDTRVLAYPPAHVAKDWLYQAQDQLEKTGYYFKGTSSSSNVAINKKQGIAVEADGKKLKVRPLAGDNSWMLDLELLSIGKGSKEKRLPRAPVVHVDRGYLKYTYDDHAIEYMNGVSGLRQNFLINEKPSGRSRLQVHLSISGSLHPQVRNGGLLLIDEATNKVYLRYDDLKVWDANNKPLAASMALLGNNELLLEVDDADAVYPVTIDPLTHTPEWTASANGVLPGLLTSLQLQIDAVVGYSVAGVGDVNADGYDDVAIGAPGAIDIVAGPATVVNAGAVFLYFGSADGLPTSPSRILRANTPAANALFGYSIAGGNVVGGKENDIVIGAPGESYRTAVSGIPSSANVTAGKVYVFNGQDLEQEKPSAFASLYLNGSGFFSSGLVGVLLSNVNINALFGFSVAVAGDMNGDGLGELVVGAPGYAGVQLADVRSGAAFVYYSTGLTTNIPVTLKAPSLLEFPLLSNINGLLFGFSVDGAGDFDKDGRQDVVVGAPGGLKLNLNDLLGGSAYVFTGKSNGTGINTSIKTQLTAGTFFIGSIADLFGYSVKGVKDANGDRTGSILVGAPAGNVLSNVSSLKLKTGNIYAFSPRADPAANIRPKQALTSPRASSLLSLLSGLNLNVTAMFGASIDNMMDLNCDGIGDIITGEPLSTAVGLVQANVVGGAAYIFLGNADGTYNPTPYWTLENEVSNDVGINAASMVGYSVAGAGRVKGRKESMRALIGAPGKAMDFSTGILALGNTLGTIFNFTSGNNGLGKAHVFGLGSSCYPVLNPDINCTFVNIPVQGNVNTNDVVPGGTIYGPAEPNMANPSGGVINMNADGTYQFSSSVAGIYKYNVQVCSPGHGCSFSLVTIAVNDDGIKQQPVANTDHVVTFSGQPVTIKSLANDAPGIPARALMPGSFVINIAPLHGTAQVDPLTGNVVYTSDPLFTGMDTLTYTVWDNTEPDALSASAIQIIRVLPPASPNSTEAADDHVRAFSNTQVSGNVKQNDTDPEGDMQTITAQDTTLPGKGTFVLKADGSFVFTPVSGFTGTVAFIYTVCDNAVPQACTNATVYITVSENISPDLTPSSRINSGTFIVSAGSTRNFVIEVNEILGRKTDNLAVPIRVTLARSNNFSYMFDPEAITATVPGTIVVNNPDWEIHSNTDSITFQLKPGVDIAGAGTSRILLRMQVLPTAALGTENHVLKIVHGSGMEIDYNNNSVVRIMNVVK